jgi:hypothetical protein
MRTLFLALLLATACCATAAVFMPSGIRSHLLIDAGKQFVLGGDQVGPFRVSARNSGRVPVLLLERANDRSAPVERGRLEPGHSAQLRFGAGAAVLVRNLGRERAEIDLDIKGPSNSKMVYEPTAAN